MTSLYKESAAPNWNVSSYLATVSPQAVGSDGFAPNQDRVLSDAVGRLQQGLHTERHCLHTLPVPVPLEQGTVQWWDDHFIAKNLQRNSQLGFNV